MFVCIKPATHTRELLAELATSRDWYSSLSGRFKMAACINIHRIALNAFLLILLMRRRRRRIRASCWTTWTKT